MEKVMLYAYEIYRQKSFSKAAEELYISQPALSAIIKKLEKELNTTLFDRSTKPLHLTESGEYYIHCVEQIMAVESSMKQYFDDLSELNVGKIAIGTSTYFCSNILPPLMRSFTEKYPGIEFSIIENNSTAQLKEYLRNGVIDLALSSNNYPEQEFASRIHNLETIILAVPRRHPVNQKFQKYNFTYEQIIENDQKPGMIYPAVRLDAFQDEKFLTIHKDSDLYPRLLAMFDEFHIKPKIAMTLQQMSSCYFLASNDFGSAILRASTLKSVKNTHNLCFYYIDSKYSTRTSRYYFRKNAYMSKAVSAFLDFAAQKSLE